jgi:hypothetical protein
LSHENDARLDLNELYTLLSEEYRDVSKYGVYNWLLNEVKKTNIFEEIEMKIDENFLNFNWYLVE